MTLLTKIEIEDVLWTELEMCKRLMESKGGCKFNGGIRCYNCGVIPLMKKLIDGVVDHRHISEIFSKENNLRLIKTPVKTEEYISILKDIMNISKSQTPLEFLTHTLNNKDEMIIEGRDSKFYIYLEELVESNPSDLETCIKLFFSKDKLDDWNKLSEIDFKSYLVELKRILDTEISKK